MLSLEFILTKFKLFFNCYFSSKIGLPQSNILTNTSSGSFVDLGEMLFKLLLSFFSIRIFFHGHWRLTGQQGKGGDHFLLHFTTSSRSRTFRHLFATLHVRWLSNIFNRNACIYQTATRWDFTTLSNYYLIDWWCYVLVTAILIRETGEIIYKETRGALIKMAVQGN